MDREAIDKATQLFEVLDAYKKSLKHLLTQKPSKDLVCLTLGEPRHSMVITTMSREGAIKILQHLIKDCETQLTKLGVNLEEDYDG